MELSAKAISYFCYHLYFLNADIKHPGNRTEIIIWDFGIGDLEREYLGSVLKTRGNF